MASLKILIAFGLFNWVICSPSPIIEDIKPNPELVPSKGNQDPEVFDCYGKNRNRKEVPVKSYLYNYTISGLPLDDMWDELEIPDCNRIRFVLHGFRQSRIEMLPIIQAFQQDWNTTVIALDWSSSSRKPYDVVIKMLDDFGFHIVPIIEKVVTASNQDPSTFHFIGFGVGAHAFCNAGRHMPGQLGQIVGLDPTISGFDENSEKDQQVLIGRDCAQFVRIIHTDGERYGLRMPKGHADYYVNGGFHQPGCQEDPLCGHLRPIRYLAEAIEMDRRFISFRCASWYDLWYNGECRLVPTKQAMYVKDDGAKCEHEDNYEEGIFYTATNAKRPFYFLSPRYIYIGRDSVHVSHTTGVYGSDYPLRLPCNGTNTKSSDIPKTKMMLEIDI